jgi:hypothetical protein
VCGRHPSSCLAAEGLGQCDRGMQGLRQTGTCRHSKRGWVVPARPPSSHRLTQPCCYTSCPHPTLAGCCRQVVQKIEYPIWVVYVTQAMMFGGGLAGISYGILSTSWDPRREGSALGWTELQVCSDMGRSVVQPNGVALQPRGHSCRFLSGAVAPATWKFGSIVTLSQAVPCCVMLCRAAGQPAHPAQQEQGPAGSVRQCVQRQTCCGSRCGLWRQLQGGHLCTQLLW